MFPKCLSTKREDHELDISQGTCLKQGNVYPALPAYGGPDGPGQMKHFYNDDKMNTFRLPVGWQYLTSTPGGTLDPNNFSRYNELMSACLNTGPDVVCIVDIHNYARWNGGIIGQGGPTNAEFANLWRQLATKYKDQSRVWFGIMNEPHDVPDINAWATSVQAAVTAIRNAGAKNPVLLPGNSWTSAEAFVSNGSADALSKVKNPDGTITNIYFDVHKYLDADNSGTHAECVMNNINNAFAPLAQWLRCHGRKAILTETGGGNTASCVKYMCEQVAFLKANSDVYLGYTGWSAGSFDSTYVLSEVPTNAGGTWTDTLLVSSCLKP
ncbi:Endoglucanase EG-II [Tulasnella sp. 418]|nr:Endoglucanase EG-II [Tulasnella sp. 418]